MDDASRAGDGFCNTTTLVCVANSGYELNTELFSGTTTVRQLAFPTGFGPGSAVLQARAEAPAALSVAPDGSVSFDSTGADNLFLLLVNVPAANPSPTARVTLPPTTTDGASGTAPGTSPAMIAITLIVVAAACAALALPRPTRPRT
jgi:hypothetical protein